MASSLQSFIGASANGLVAGLIAPLVMHSAVAMAIVSLGMLGLGLQAWLWAHRRWPDIGRSVVNPDH
jgi:DHA1 family bicyclomycin/chloramphenicol resistance-like MFS transporter